MQNVIELPANDRAKQAVILSRVSSKEQEQGYSIDAQKHRLETYCERKRLSIIQSFALTESSTQGDRKKFMEVIRFIKKQKQVIALVADKVDRLQRSFKEYPLLDELVNAGKIELHFNTENYIIHKDSVSQERLMWSMSVIMAQSYIDSMRDNVKRSIEQKIRLGEWIGSAPIGYLNVRQENGRSWVDIDPERGLLVRRIFQEYSTGLYTLSEMVKKTKEWGLKNKSGKKSYLSESHIHAIINNPFYYGRMRIKGIVYPHSYEPLIDKALFDQCQAVLNAWNKKPFKYAAKEFVFRGLITCATSGRVVTADTKKKTYKSGKTAQWTYLRCWNPDNPEKKIFVREEKVLAQVQEVFDSLHIPPEYIDKITSYIRRTDLVERDYVRRQLKALQEEQLRLIAQKDRILELLLEKVITQDDYQRKNISLMDALDDIETQIHGHRSGNEKCKDALIDLFFLTSEASKYFKSSTIKQKRRLVNLVFANLQLKGDKLLYSLNYPFNNMQDLTQNQEWRALVDSLRTHTKGKRTIIDMVQFLKSIAECW